MKYYLVFLLLILCVFVYSKDYSFEYKTMPKSIDCEINLYMNNQKDGKKYIRTNQIFINTVSVEEIENQYFYNTKIKQVLSEKQVKTIDLKFQAENKKTYLDVKKITNLPIYDYANINENLFSSQLFFLSNNLKVGDSWDSTVFNPLGEKLIITNRLVRVADNIATISFNCKSPYRGNIINTERELMEMKKDIGSTFKLLLDVLSGHAEINCSGVWNFNVDTGQILKSDQFYKINSLMRKNDNEEIISMKDFIYADVFIALKYEFIY